MSTGTHAARSNINPRPPESPPACVCAPQCNKLRTLDEKLTTPQVEQIAAKYQIELVEYGKLT